MVMGVMGWIGWILVAFGLGYVAGRIHAWTGSREKEKPSPRRGGVTSTRIKLRGS